MSKSVPFTHVSGPITQHDLHFGMAPFFCWPIAQFNHRRNECWRCGTFSQYFAFIFHAHFLFSFPFSLDANRFNEFCRMKIKNMLWKNSLEPIHIHLVRPPASNGISWWRFVPFLLDLLLLKRNKKWLSESSTSNALWQECLTQTLVDAFWTLNNIFHVGINIWNDQLKCRCNDQSYIDRCCYLYASHSRGKHTI